MKRCYGVVTLLIILHANLFAGIYPVQNGILDLRNHNWQKDGIVNISGNWEFYWNKFYTPSFLNNADSIAKKQYALVPDFWNRYVTPNKKNHTGLGYATYHVRLLCPSSNEQLALKILTVQGAYNLFINGKKVIEVGEADTTKSKAKTNLKPIVLNVQPENNVIDIVLQVSNFDNRKGGLWDVVKIGTQSEIQQEISRNISLEFIIAGIFLLAFIYNLILYLYFRKRYGHLFFSILCLLIFTRILVTADIPLNYLHEFNWETIRRLEYVSLYFSVPVMCLFSYFLFPNEFSKKLLYVIILIAAVFILISLFGSYYAYTFVIRYYQAYMVIAVFYGLYVYIKAFINKRPGSVLCTIGFVIFLATIINDVLYADLIIESVPLFYAGLLLFVLLLSIILSKQFAQIFADLEIANKQLAEVNNTLGMMNETMQQKNEELNKINNELDIFVHRTSHDLRAPLSSVAGMTYVMESETNVSTLHDYALLQQKTLQRMDDLIKDIIDFSKNKKMQLTLGEVDFAKLVESSLEDHSHAKNACDIRINVKVLQQRKFISDERRINAIINNLISNAIKYCDISKPDPKIDINVLVTETEASFEIIDNGIGIDEKHLQKIFTMFYRATSNASGSGLGLYIIQQTVEKLGGKINFESKKGEGTTIKINIPDKSNEL